METIVLIWQTTPLEAESRSTVTKAANFMDRVQIGQNIILGQSTSPLAVWYNASMKYWQLEK